jgi:polyisoprenyl-phosphate glycosyltransferase
MARASAAGRSSCRIKFGAFGIGAFTKCEGPCYGCGATSLCCILMRVMSPGGQNCTLSVLVPAYQEGAHLWESMVRIIEAVARVTPHHEILIIDDGSTDNTWEQVTRLHQQYPAIQGFRLSRNFGKEYALSAGLDAAAGSAVLMMDADLQHPVHLIGTLFSLWSEGHADVVEGTKRYREQEGLLRQMVSRLFNSIATRCIGMDVRNSSDFMLIDRRVVDAWRSLGEKRCFVRGMMRWVGFRHIEVQFDVDPRCAGHSKFTFRSLANLAWRALVSYSAVPLRLIHLIAIAFLVFAVLLAARALYLYVLGTAVTGFSTVIILILIVGGLILSCLGVIAEYLIAVYDELKARPRYIVAERT